MQRAEISRPRYHLSSLLPHGRQPHQVRLRSLPDRSWRVYLNAVTGVPVAAYLRIAPSGRSSGLSVFRSSGLSVIRLSIRLSVRPFHGRDPRSVRSSEMYSPAVTTRLSPPGSSLFSLLKVTLSLHSLFRIHLMLRLYKNGRPQSTVFCHFTTIFRARFWGWHILFSQTLDQPLREAIP